MRLEPAKVNVLVMPIHPYTRTTHEMLHPPLTFILTCLTTPLPVACVLSMTVRSSQLKPVVTATIGHDSVGSGISSDGLNAAIQIETEVSPPAQIVELICEFKGVV